MIGIIQKIGSIVSVIVLIALGIKYMVGSIEERAQYKETMIPYVIGALLIFAASILSQIIYNMFTSITVNNGTK